MANATLGSVTIPLPIGYVLEPIKFETRDRSLDGTMLVNYAVNSEDTAITKYHFELPGIIKSLRLAIRAEALKTGNIEYIDHIQIAEVLSYDGTTGTLSLQRQLGTTSANDITILHGGTTQSITITTGTTAGAGEVFITSSGQMYFGTSSGGTNNIIVYYPPKYTVHILSDRQELLYKSSTTDHLVRYNLILEEV